MSNDVAISIKKVSKKYKLYDKPFDRLKEALHPLKKQYHKEFYALKDINLEVKKGEVLGIVGVNGAGKSTLLKIISGVLNPTIGKVNVDGNVNAILELNAGLHGELTGIENIKLNFKINSPNKDSDLLLSEIVKFADIGDHIYQPVKTYSSGMKSRLGFGIAISANPEILIIDEVLAVGDAVFRKKCYEKINSLVESGKTVIFVSHSMSSVVEFCSRAVLLFNKRIILDDKPKRVTDLYEKLIFADNADEVISQNISLGDVNNGQLKQKKLETHLIDRPLIDHNLLNLGSNEVKTSDNVCLDKVTIYEQQGLKTNILHSDNTYKISVYLKVNPAFREVMAEKLYGVTFVNHKGVRVAGLKLKLSEYDVNSIVVEAEFKCIFQVGVYSVILAVKDEHEMHEYDLWVLDSIFFRVINNTSQIRWALVQL